MLKYRSPKDNFLLLPRKRTNPSRHVEMKEEYPSIENKIRQIIKESVTIFLKFQ